MEHSFPNVGHKLMGLDNQLMVHDRTEARWHAPESATCDALSLYSTQ